MAVTGVAITQANVLRVAELAFGAPLAVTPGGAVWRRVVDYTPSEDVQPLARPGASTGGPLALMVANSLAAWPGHRTARLRIGQVLRAE